MLSDYWWCLSWLRRGRLRVWLGGSASLVLWWAWLRLRGDALSFMRVLWMGCWPLLGCMLAGLDGGIMLLNMVRLLGMSLGMSLSLLHR